MTPLEFEEVCVQLDWEWTQDADGELSMTFDEWVAYHREQLERSKYLSLANFTTLNHVPTKETGQPQ